MKLPVEKLPPEVVTGIRERIFALLVASPFRQPRLWPHAIGVFTPERRAIVSRAGFAAELRAAGLEQAAHEAMVRRVGNGELLAYVLRDDADSAGVEFVIVPMLSGVR